MSKFKVFEANQKLMAPLGIYPYDLNAPTNRAFNTFGAYYIFVITSILMTTSCAIFLPQNNSGLLMIFEAVLVVVGGIQYIGLYLSVGFNIDSVKILHLKLQKIVDKVAENHSDVIDIYWRIEEKGRKFTGFLSYYIIVDQTLSATALIVSIYNICTGNFDTSTWILPFNLYVPFDMSKVYIWFIEWFIQFGVTIIYGLIIVAVPTYFVCSCFYIDAICDHFDLLIRSANNDVERIQMTKSNRNCQQLHQQARIKVAQAVEIHVTLFEIFNLIANIHSGAIFALLPTNAIFQGCSMYTTEHSPFDATSLSLHVTALLCSFIWPFLYCHFASLATCRISSIGDIVYTSNWYNYPPDVQRYFILIIARSKNPIHFTGLNYILCSVEMFGILFKSACSYYIIFRNLSQH